MKVRDIYNKYNIPPNLQQHMIWVATVAGFIADHWLSKNLDKNRLIKAALVHDLGNIVKFNFDKYPEFLGNEINNLEYWKEKQKEIIAKYGSDDHLVTQKMLNEIGLDNKSIEAVSSKSFANAVNTLNSDNLYLKILLYSDMRVLPLRICSLEDRLKDIMQRMPQYYTRPDINDLLDACRKIEAEIQQNLDCDVEKINQQNLLTDTNDLLEIEI